VLPEIVARFAAIVESTDDAIISRGLDGKITSWNPAAERMFGHRADEMLGQPLGRLIPAERADEDVALLRRIERGDRIEQHETIRRRKDGTTVPVAITFSPIWGFAGGAPGGRQIVGVSEIMRDIGERKRAEAQVEAERAFANSLIESMPGIFYFYDDKGRFLRWNHNFERMAGRSADEIARMHPLEFFAEGERALLQERIATVFETGEASVEAALVAKDGTSTPCFFTGRRIMFKGTPCLVGVGVDISEQKRAEAELRKSEERYRSTLDSSLEGCQLLDFDWRYLYLNGAAETQNRRPNAELLGRRMPDVWPGIEASPVFALLRRCMHERVSLHEETEFVFGDGSKGWFDIRCQPAPEGIFILSLDISERKRADLLLREVNEGLERKVAERTRDLEAARVRAEAADRLKSAFLATMSHELRTPLNSIIGFTGIVLQGLPGPLNAEQSKQLGMVRSSARHLLELINDVLDISKIEAGQLVLQVAPFDPLASIARVAESVRPLLEKKGLALRLALPAALDEMLSDRRRLEQILINLVNNAIKFTDVGEVTLTAEVGDFALGADAARRGLRLQVRDTGIGMKADALPGLFAPFHQIDSGLERQHEGTGLGLAICRRLAELLGGSIEVASEWGKGSVFTVTLPMSSPGSKR
jgi:PAS domain S-box-containing protein